MGARVSGRRSTHATPHAQVMSMGTWHRQPSQRSRGRCWVIQDGSLMGKVMRVFWGRHGAAELWPCRLTEHDRDCIHFRTEGTSSFPRFWPRINMENLVLQKKTATTLRMNILLYGYRTLQPPVGIQLQPPCPGIHTGSMKFIHNKTRLKVDLYRSSVRH